MTKSRSQTSAARVLLAASIFLLAVSRSRSAEPDALERATFLDDSGKSVAIDGKVVVEAEDGGYLFLARDGQLFTVGPKKQVSREPAHKPFTRLNADELGQDLKEEFGPGFEIVQTRHYVIATSAGPVYARWCGDLFERLLAGFLEHWKGLGLALTEPAWPLPAVVFASEQDFKDHAAAEAGEFGETSKGYYSIRTNRIVLFDLTAPRGRGRAKTAAEVKRKAAAAAFNVATIVHEATHQIAFNSGLHTRLADNPHWLTEGMAMYFEVPDLEDTRGWKTIGQVNRLRLNRFGEFVRRRRKRDSLTTLVSRPDRFVDAHKAADGYAEAWALTWFLAEKHPDLYVKYLKQMSHKHPLIPDDPATRLAEFQSVFGSDLKTLDREFLQSMKSLSPSKR